MSVASELVQRQREMKKGRACAAVAAAASAAEVAVRTAEACRTTQMKRAG